MTTIALTGGGTAGHILPAMALLPDLEQNFERIIHIGGDGMEKNLVPRYGIDFFRTDTIKFDRARPWKNVKIPFVLCIAVRQAKDILIREKVDVVFSKGGYCSLPTVIGANKLGIPVIVHESDYNMGLANRFASRYANSVLTSFPETKGGLYVGNPIRKEIFAGSREKALRTYGINKNKRTILIFGGSSGARAINDAVFKVIGSVNKQYNVIHIIGSKEKRRLFAKDYVSLPYVENMGDIYALADLIIMRGGANSLQETTALGKRIICIPLPKSKYSRGDQIDNAQSYHKRGLINILEQDKLTPETLVEQIEIAINQKEHPVCRDTPNGEIVKKIMELI